MFKKLVTVIKNMEIVNEKSEPEVISQPEISQDGGPIADEKPVIEDIIEELVEDKENGQPDKEPNPEDTTPTDSNPPAEEELTTQEKSVSVSIGPVTEVQEVSSSTRNETSIPTQRNQRRRSSYQGGSGRGYAGGFQNYGLTYLPYKSNFEPSEDARRRADEFLKTLKL